MFCRGFRDLKEVVLFDFVVCNTCRAILRYLQSFLLVRKRVFKALLSNCKIIESQCVIANYLTNERFCQIATQSKVRRKTWHLPFVGACFAFLLTFDFGCSII